MIKVLTFFDGNASSTSFALLATASFVDLTASFADLAAFSERSTAFLADFLALLALLELEARADFLEVFELAERTDFLEDVSFDWAELFPTAAPVFFF